MEDGSHSETVTEHEKLSDEAKQLALLRGSYQLAQGNPELNLPILDYLTRIQVFNPTALLAIPQERIIKYLTPPKQHTLMEPANIQADVVKTLKSIQQLVSEQGLSTQTEISLESLAEDILSGVISSDLKYQQGSDILTRGQRPNRDIEDQTQIESDSPFDPHASLLRRYVIKRTPLIAGRGIDDPVNSAFSMLFEDMGHALDTINATEWTSENFEVISLKKNLDELKYNWEQKHPGERFYPLETE